MYSVVMVDMYPLVVVTITSVVMLYGINIVEYIGPLVVLIIAEDSVAKIAMVSFKNVVAMIVGVLVTVASFEGAVFATAGVPVVLVSIGLHLVLHS